MLFYHMWAGWARRKMSGLSLLIIFGGFIFGELLFFEKFYFQKQRDDI